MRVTFRDESHPSFVAGLAGPAWPGPYLRPTPNTNVIADKNNWPTRRQKENKVNRENVSFTSFSFSLILVWFGLVEFFTVFFRQFRHINDPSVVTFGSSIRSVHLKGFFLRSRTRPSNVFPVAQLETDTKIDGPVGGKVTSATKVSRNQVRRRRQSLWGELTDCLTGENRDRIARGGGGRRGEMDNTIDDVRKQVNRTKRGVRF